MRKTNTGFSCSAMCVTTVAVWLLLLLSGGCSSSKEASGEDMLLGWVDREAFFRPEYPRFEARYDTLQFSSDIVPLIHDVSDDVEWIVFFGTWCSDSWREVPTFLKIADSAGIDGTRIRFYALDRSKKSSDGLTDRYNVTMVPTIVFLRRGEEIGRIVERPEGAMEDNVLSILAGSPGP